jgi:hypothetical protein
VLEQHADAGNAAPGEALGEGAGQDRVLAEIGDVEEAAIALEGAVFGDPGEGLGEELRLAGVPRYATSS